MVYASRFGISRFVFELLHKPLASGIPYWMCCISGNGNLQPPTQPCTRIERTYPYTKKGRASPKPFFNNRELPQHHMFVFAIPSHQYAPKPNVLQDLQYDMRCVMSCPQHAFSCFAIHTTGYALTSHDLQDLSYDMRILMLRGDPQNKRGWAQKL